MTKLKRLNNCLGRASALPHTASIPVLAAVPAVSASTCMDNRSRVPQWVGAQKHRQGRGGASRIGLCACVRVVHRRLGPYYHVRMAVVGTARPSGPPHSWASRVALTQLHAGTDAS